MYFYFFTIITTNTCVTYLINQTRSKTLKKVISSPTGTSAPSDCFHSGGYQDGGSVDPYVPLTSTAQVIYLWCCANVALANGTTRFTIAKLPAD